MSYIEVFGRTANEDSLEHFKRDLAACPLMDDDIIRIRNLCQQVRETSDRAVFVSEWPFHTSICIHGWGGMAVFPILCITEPEFVHELHAIACEYTVKNIQMILPEIAPFVDILMMAARSIKSLRERYDRRSGSV